MIRSFYKTLFYSTSIFALSALNPAHSFASSTNGTLVPNLVGMIDAYNSTANLPTTNVAITVSNTPYVVTANRTNLAFGSQVYDASRQVGVPLNVITSSAPTIALPTITDNSYILNFTSAGNQDLNLTDAITISEVSGNIGDVSIVTGNISDTISTGGITLGGLPAISFVTNTGSVSNITGGIALTASSNTSGAVTITNSGTIPTKTTTLGGLPAISLSDLPASRPFVVSIAGFGEVTSPSLDGTNISFSSDETVSVVTLAPGARINFSNGGSIVNSGNVAVNIDPNLLNNHPSGQVDVAAASATTALTLIADTSSIGASIDTYGAINISGTSGGVAIDGAGSALFTGTISSVPGVSAMKLTPGVEIDFPNGSSLINSGAVLVDVDANLLNNPSAGQVDVGVASAATGGLTIKSTITNAGSIVGSANFSDAVTFISDSDSSGAVIITEPGTSISIDGLPIISSKNLPATSPGAISIAGFGEITSTGTLSGTNITFSSGEIVNSVTLAPGANINFNNGGAIINSGTVPVNIDSDLLNNHPSGQVDVSAANSNNSSTTNFDLNNIVVPRSNGGTISNTMHHPNLSVQPINAVAALNTSGTNNTTNLSSIANSTNISETINISMSSSINEAGTITNANSVVGNINPTNSSHIVAASPINIAFGSANIESGQASNPNIIDSSGISNTATPTHDDFYISNFTVVGNQSVGFIDDSGNVININDTPIIPVSVNFVPLPIKATPIVPLTDNNGAGTTVNRATISNSMYTPNLSGQSQITASSAISSDTPSPANANNATTSLNIVSASGNVSGQIPTPVSVVDSAINVSNSSIAIQDQNILNISSHTPEASVINTTTNFANSNASVIIVTANAITAEGTITTVNPSQIEISGSVIPMSSDAITLSESSETGIVIDNAPTALTTAVVSTQNQFLGIISGHLADIREASDGSGIATGSEALDKAIWGQVFGGTATQGYRAGVTGYDSDVWGMAIGIDKDLFKDTNIGVSFSYAKTDVDSLKGRTDVDSYQGTVYGSYEQSKWYAEGMVGVGVNSYDNKRNVTLGSIANVASADYDGMQYTAKVTGGYKLAPLNDFNITPLASLQYTLLHQDSYTETGSTSNLAVHDNDTNTLQSGLGAKISRTLNVGSYTISPAVRAMWLYDFAANTQATSSSLANNPSVAFTSAGVESARNALDLGLGVQLIAGDQVAISADYDYQAKEKYNSHTGALKAKYKF